MIKDLSNIIRNKEEYVFKLNEELKDCDNKYVKLNNRYIKRVWMKWNKDLTVEDANKYIKDEINKEMEQHRFEHDVFYQAVEEVLLSIAPLYLADEKYAKHNINII